METLHTEGYRVFPSVVPVGVPTEVLIIPQGENTDFPDGYEYTVELYGVAVATTHLDHCDGKRQVLQPENGILRFMETFEREQQYVLKIVLPETLRYCSNPYYQPPAHGRVPRRSDLAQPLLYIYALESDLYPYRVFKGDFHIHSFDSDGHESSCGVAANLRKAGYDFLAMTNHYWYHSGAKIAEKLRGVEDIIVNLPAEEIHTPTESIHIVGVGQTQSVNDWYYRHREQCDAEIREIEASLTDLPASIDPHNYASRLWTVRKIKEFGGLSIMAHTHWIWNHVYYVPEDVAIRLFEERVFDAYELLNGCCGPETNRLQMALYYEEQRKGFEMPIVGSSDSHQTDGMDEDYPTPAFTLVFARDRSFGSIRDAILERRCVAVEKYAADKEFRIYGPYRMVKYANFLMKNYYPIYTKLCRGQGTLLREYETAPSEETADLIRKLAARSEAFARRFYGRKG